MRLIFLRHAEAAKKNEADSELEDYRRELTRQGIVHAKEMVYSCTFLWKNTRAIFTSSYPRAIQTAQILHRQFPSSDLDMKVELDKFQDPAAIIRFIKTLKNGSYTFVGHDPNLSLVISRLAAGSSHPIVHLPKAGLVVLDGPDASSLKIRTVLTSRIVMKL
jgi:phosphohistidine phosphatase SixA